MSPPRGPVLTLFWLAPQAAIPNATTPMMLTMKTLRSALMNAPRVRNADNPHWYVEHSARSSSPLEKNDSFECSRRMRQGGSPTGGHGYWRMNTRRCDDYRCWPRPARRSSCGRIDVLDGGATR